MRNTVRRLLFGSPLASSRGALERLGIPLAFVIVSANALSSVAYASEEILIALQPGGATGHIYLLLISLAVVVLIFLVVLHYDSVIRVYPGGGGAYSVARENLGTTPGGVAGASLLVDYTLTVSVSVVAGAAAVGSAFPAFTPYQTGLAILLVCFLTIINLHGIRQSAQFLALPVYVFIGSFLLMLVMGAYRYITQGAPPVTGQRGLPAEVEVLGLFLVLRAFSSGCVAMTGIEAISNTMGIFKAPVERNARFTLLFMGLLLAGLFSGLGALAFLFGLEPAAGETLVSQVARASFGSNVFYYLVQVSTLLILVVAANTSFSSFPQLAAVLARDGFVPRPLSNLGDRLVYSNGILLLAAVSILLIVVFQGNTHYLLPLYAIGVIVGFTLSQGGMARYWWKRQERSRLTGLLVSSIGAGITGVVLLILIVEKFTAGAWMVVVAIPLLLLAFIAIRGHYRTVAETLSLDHYVPAPPAVQEVVIVPIGGVHRAVLPALEYAQLIGTRVEAVHIAADEEASRGIQDRWALLQTNIPLTVIPSPYREVVGPLVRYIQEVVAGHPLGHVTVVIPEFVPKRWWQQLLHNHTALLLKLALSSDQRIMAVSVPYHLPR
jgi:amino acid transporter